LSRNCWSGAGTRKFTCPGKKQAVLNRLVEAFILRDALDLHRIKNPKAFRRLMGLAAPQIGDLANFFNFAEPLGIGSNEPL